MEKRVKDFFIVGIFLIVALYSVFFAGIFKAAEERQILFSPDNPSGSCTDSDEGIYPSTQGVVTSGNYNFGENIILSDYCLDSNTLIEYSCDLNNTYSARSYNCKDGCNAGACNAVRKSFLLKTTRFVSDDLFNYTSIQEDSGSGLQEICSKKKKGDSCFVDDLNLSIDDVGISLPDKWAKFHHGSAGKSFRAVYDTLRNKLYLPISTDVPASSIVLTVTEVDGSILQTFNFSWSNSVININKSNLLEGKQHYFDFYSVGNSVFLNLSMEHGTVSFSILYGDGNEFTKIGLHNSNLLATSDDYNLFYNETKGDNRFVLSLGNGGANNTICSASYLANLSKCLPDEKIVKYFVSNNSCGISVPENVTLERCDYDGNNIIGNKSDVNSSFNFTINEDGQAINFSKRFNGTRSLTFNEGGNVRVSFDFDFEDGSLDLTAISLDKQNTSSSFGYFIVEGLDVKKTVYVDRLMNNSNSVCVEAKSIDNIGDISRTCSGSNEHIVLCDGNKYWNNYTCVDSGGDYKVSDLENSGIKEFEYLAGNRSCIASWNCTEWTACTGGSQERSCTDINDCASSLNKPTETQICLQTSEKAKTCLDLGGEICKLDEECSVGTIDSADGNCCLGVCKEESKVSSEVYFWVIVFILTLSIIIIMAIIFFSLKKKSVEKTLKKFS